MAPSCQSADYQDGGEGGSILSGSEIPSCLWQSLFYQHLPIATDSLLPSQAGCQWIGSPMARGSLRISPLVFYGWTDHLWRSPARWLEHTYDPAPGLFSISKKGGHMIFLHHAANTGWQKWMWHLFMTLSRVWCDRVLISISGIVEVICTRPPN